MNTDVRTVIAVAALATASVAPFVAHGVAPDITCLGTAVTVVCSGLLYAAALWVCALPGRGGLAAGHAAFAALVGGLWWQNVLVAFAAWVVAYVVAWSIARRRSLGILGLLVTVCALVAGAGLSAIALVGAGMLNEPVSPGETASLMVRILWCTLGIAHGALWLDEHLRERFARWAAHRRAMRPAAGVHVASRRTNP